MANCPIIAVANPKGGTGKTTTCVNLCCALAATRRKILMIDLDPQCSATVALGFTQQDSPLKLDEIIMDGADLNEAIVSYRQGLIDLILGTEDLNALPVLLRDEADGLLRLKQALSKLNQAYDLIFIDCPPALNLLTLNALCAADRLLIPTTLDYMSIDGLSNLITTYDRLNCREMAAVKLIGIVPTMVGESTELGGIIKSTLYEQFGDLLMMSSIAFNDRISESTSTGRPVMLYDRTSQGAIDYLALAGELLQKLD